MVKLTTHADSLCGVARPLDAIGDWWSLLIVRDAFDRLRRFGEFQRSLGLAKNILSVRLRNLVTHGVMQTAPASDGSAYQEYVLTEKGRGLFPVLVALRQWGEDFSSSRKRRMSYSSRGKPAPRSRSSSCEPGTGADWHPKTRSLCARRQHPRENQAGRRTRRIADNGVFGLFSANSLHRSTVRLRLSAARPPPRVPPALNRVHMIKIFAVFAALPLLGLAACGSSPTTSNGAGLSTTPAARASDSAMAFTSRRTPSSIASCLTSRLRGVHRASGGSATELAIGNGARADTWHITLTPAGAGSAVNVRRPSSDDGSVSEPELRYHIARCVV